MANAVELITFTTVIGSYVFGPVTGMIIGGLSILGTYIFEKRISKYSLATVPLYIVLGYLTFFLKPYVGDIKILGIIISLTYNVIINIVLKILYHARYSKMASFSIINILFNVYLFSEFSQVLLKLVQIK